MDYPNYQNLSGEKIQALQWYLNTNEIIAWLEENLVSEVANTGTAVGYWLKTKNGDIMISWNDYIIKRQDGTLETCKPDKFWQEWTLIEDESKCPECGSDIIEKMSGIKCSKCDYWDCA